MVQRAVQDLSDKIEETFVQATGTCIYNSTFVRWGEECVLRCEDYLYSSFCLSTLSSLSSSYLSKSILYKKRLPPRPHDEFSIDHVLKVFLHPAANKINKVQYITLVVRHLHTSLFCKDSNPSSSIWTNWHLKNPSCSLIDTLRNICVDEQPLCDLTMCGGRNYVSMVRLSSSLKDVPEFTFPPSLTTLGELSTYTFCCGRGIIMVTFHNSSRKRITSSHSDLFMVFWGTVVTHVYCYMWLITITWTICSKRLITCWHYHLF